MEKLLWFSLSDCSYIHKNLIITIDTKQLMDLIEIKSTYCTHATLNSLRGEIQILADMTRLHE